MTRVPFDELVGEFRRVLDAEGFSAERSRLLARTFAENSRDGVHSHGLNRFPGFIDFVRRGVVDLHAEPELAGSFGGFERWDGRRGPGILNASFAMGRAVELAAKHGVGCAALRNTNHWMRAGTYALQAAARGCVGVCWTNTTAIMPAWGGTDVKLGNNPIAVCVPRRGGDPVLLDMAMSQFSVGRLLIAARSGERLPVPGGLDGAGNATDDAAEILRSKALLPIGYWKGSGLALLLDCAAALLAAGEATFHIAARPEETGVSQVFLAFDLAATGSEVAREVVERIVEDACQATPRSPGAKVAVPGQRTAERRRTSEAEGIPVDPELWEKVKGL